MQFTQGQKSSEENGQAKINTIDVELNEDQLQAVSGGFMSDVSMAVDIGKFIKDYNDPNLNMDSPNRPQIGSFDPTK